MIAWATIRKRHAAWAWYGAELASEVARDCSTEEVHRAPLTARTAGEALGELADRGFIRPYGRKYVRNNAPPMPTNLREA
jgi:hypothetical protein